MKSKVLFCIVASCLCCNVVAKHSHCSHCDQKITTSGASQTHTGHHSHGHHSPSDGEVAKMAISTLASMATNLLSIGSDPHNPQNVGTNVVGMLSSFINLITFALKNPQIAELMEDELFKQELQVQIVRCMEAMKAEIAEGGVKNEEC
jgi:hypothetical protein